MVGSRIGASYRPGPDNAYFGHIWIASELPEPIICRAGVGDADGKTLHQWFELFPNEDKTKTLVRPRNRTKIVHLGDHDANLADYYVLFIGMSGSTPLFFQIFQKEGYPDVDWFRTVDDRTSHIHGTVLEARLQAVLAEIEQKIGVRGEAPVWMHPPGR